MNERSLRVLEFTKIRAQLAQYCVSDMGRALCDALTPSNRLEDVLRMQQETEEAHSLLSYLGGTPMLSFSDVHASLHLAQIGSSLSPRALMEIGASLRAARAAREAIVTDRQDTPLMSANASRLSTFKDIEQAISDAIISEDEIADRASNELFQIRRKMRACNERVRERLNGMIHNPNFQKYLQDAIITMRADRYVLPVRQEYRSMVPGIVHDQSSTGATVFIEPMSVVEIGNELKQLISAEKVEIEKILRTLSAQIAPEADTISDNLAILAQLDFAFAKASLAKQMNGCMPKINREGRLNIVRGRHPLIDPQKVVPLDIRLGAEYFIDDKFPEHLEGNPLTMNCRHVLVEFSINGYSLRAFDMLFEATLSGYEIILAHPERYAFVQANGKDKVINLIKQYKLQLNLLSLAGYHGSGAKKYAEQMLRQGLYTFVGTDTHSNAYLDALQRARISKKVFDAVNVLKENNRTLF